MLHGQNKQGDGSQKRDEDQKHRPQGGDTGAQQVVQAVVGLTGGDQVEEVEDEEECTEDQQENDTDPHEVSQPFKSVKSVLVFHESPDHGDE